MTERERLHPSGVALQFAGWVWMTPEAADAFAYGLVRLDRSTGKWRRAQLSPEDEKRIIESVRDRETAEASMVNGEPTSWSSGRAPFPRSESSQRKAKR
jgi:hypothetical protein